MSLRTLVLTVPALALLGVAATAFIHPSAVSASHAFQESGIAAHDYMHENYPSAYGAHGLETAATTLHTTLHDWQNGSASECDVRSDRWASRVALFDMTKQWIQNGIVLDPNATSLLWDNFGNYTTVHLYTVFATPCR